MDYSELQRLCESDQASDRLRALKRMCAEIAEGAAPEDYLDLARPLVGDLSNDCRWQALIVIGESIESNPEAVWEVIREHGVSEDEDMRAGVATVLLEHHFDWTFGRVRKEIEGGANLLADTLASCWAFGEAEDRWDEVKPLIRRAS